MRNLTLILAVFILFSGCQEDETPLFTMVYYLDIPFVPETNSAKTLVVRDGRVISLFDEKLMENNLKAEDIQTVRVRSARLLPIDHNINYGVLARIEVNIFELSDPNDLLPIADLVPLPTEDRGPMPLIPGLPNVKRFVEQDIFGLDVGYRYRRPFQDRVMNRLELTLEAL